MDSLISHAMFIKQLRLYSVYYTVCSKLVFYSTQPELKIVFNKS